MHCIKNYIHLYVDQSYIIPVRIYKLHNDADQYAWFASVGLFELKYYIDALDISITILERRFSEASLTICWKYFIITGCRIYLV